MCYNYGTYEELQDAYDHGWLTDDDVNLCPNHVTLGATTIFVTSYCTTRRGRKSWWYVSVHSLTLATVEMWDEIMGAYVLFGVVASIIDKARSVVVWKSLYTHGHGTVFNIV